MGMREFALEEGGKGGATRNPVSKGGVGGVLLIIFLSNFARMRVVRSAVSAD